MENDEPKAPAQPNEPPRPKKRSQQALDDYLSALFPMPADTPVTEVAPTGSAPQPRETVDAVTSPQSERAEEPRQRTADEDAAWIERALIEPNPSQPRRTWSEASLRELGQSLARDGQLQACVVRPHPAKPGRFQIVSGERRWRASGPEFANLSRLRCTVREVGDDESMRLALIENLQREELNDIDKARAFVELRDSLRASDPRVTWSHVAQAVGLSREYLQRLKALLDLPEEVQEMVRGGSLSGRSARALTSLRDSEAQVQLAREIQRGSLSSDQAAQRARDLNAARDAAQAPQESESQAPVTRGSHSDENGSEWEGAVKKAVALLAQARQHSGEGRAPVRRKKARKLVEQARAHVEALAAELAKE